MTSRYVSRVFDRGGLRWCHSMVFVSPHGDHLHQLPRVLPLGGGAQSSSAGTVPAAAAAKAAAVARLDPASSAPRRLAGVNRDRAAGGVGGGAAVDSETRGRRERFQIERLGRERRASTPRSVADAKRFFSDENQPRQRARARQSSVPLAALGRRRFARRGVPKHLRLRAARRRDAFQAFQAFQGLARARPRRSPPRPRRAPPKARGGLDAREEPARPRRCRQRRFQKPRPRAAFSRERRRDGAFVFVFVRDERSFVSRYAASSMPPRRPRRRRARARRARAARPRTPPGRSKARRRGRSGTPSRPPRLPRHPRSLGRVVRGPRRRREPARAERAPVEQCVARIRVVFHRVMLFLRSVGRLPRSSLLRSRKVPAIRQRGGARRETREPFRKRKRRGGEAFFERGGIRARRRRRRVAVIPFRDLRRGSRVDDVLALALAGGIRTVRRRSRRRGRRTGEGIRAPASVSSPARFDFALPNSAASGVPASAGGAEAEASASAPAAGIAWCSSVHAHENISPFFFRSRSNSRAASRANACAASASSKPNAAAANDAVAGTFIRVSLRGGVSSASASEKASEPRTDPFRETDVSRLCGCPAPNASANRVFAEASPSRSRFRRARAGRRPAARLRWPRAHPRQRTPPRRARRRRRVSRAPAGAAARAAAGTSGGARKNSSYIPVAARSRAASAAMATVSNAGRARGTTPATRGDARTSPRRARRFFFARRASSSANAFCSASAALPKRPPSPPPPSFLFPDPSPRRPPLRQPRARPGGSRPPRGTAPRGRAPCAPGERAASPPSARRADAREGV